MRKLNTSLFFLPLLVACTEAEVADIPVEEDSASIASSSDRGPESWEQNFPAQADLAILLDVLDAPLIDVNTTDANGSSLLPKAWLQEVQDAYANTDVGDALQLENRYEQWRLVSVRISPCAPIGIRPDIDIDTWCWPAVRLVWQPVVDNHRVHWGTLTDYFADDRAIHAIYPVAPRNRDGDTIEGEWRETVTAHLAAGRDPSELSERMQTGFKAVRDATAIAVLDATHALRDPTIRAGAYEGIELRPELFDGENEFQETNRTAQFTTKLERFLGEFASWQQLDELTSFSLPEGRNPSSSDIWVFVGFHGNNGFPELKDLEVIGRYSGDKLVNIGPSQTVAVGVEDERVEEALAQGNRELSESLIVSPSDIEEIGPDMADPYEFLVPNTSCASCHRLNGLRFDFHSLSGFEDRGITVSPRVNKDVARDMMWTRSALRSSDAF